MSVKLTAWSKVVFFKESLPKRQISLEIQGAVHVWRNDSPRVRRSQPISHKSRWGFFCCIFFPEMQINNPSFRFGKATGIEVGWAVFKSFMQHNKVTCFKQPSKTQTGKLIGKNQLMKVSTWAIYTKVTPNASLVRESYPKWPKHSDFRILLWIAQIHTSRKNKKQHKQFHSNRLGNWNLSCGL